MNSYISQNKYYKKNKEIKKKIHDMTYSGNTYLMKNYGK